MEFPNLMKFLYPTSATSHPIPSDVETIPSDLETIPSMETIPSHTETRPRKKTRSILNTKKSPSSSSKINITLLIDKNKKKVLCAEAGKDFVDFLFGLLELPLGSIFGLLVERGMAKNCSVGRVYESVKNFDNNFVQSNQTKNSLLKPTKSSSSSNDTKTNPLLKEFTKEFSPLRELNLKFSKAFSPSLLQPYFCPTIHPLPSQYRSFLGTMYGQVDLNTTDRHPAQVDGYVKGITVKYLVMDDLTVKPLSTISSIKLIKSFQIKDIDSIEEKTIQVDLEKALKLVKASFESTEVLTEVFITNMAEVDPKESTTTGKRKFS